MLSPYSLFSNTKDRMNYRAGVLVIFLVVADSFLIASVRKENTREHIRSLLGFARENLAEKETIKHIRGTDKTTPYRNGHLKDLKREDILPKRHEDSVESVTKEFPARKNELEIRREQKREEMGAIPDQWWKGRFKYFDEEKEDYQGKKN